MTALHGLWRAAAAAALLSACAPVSDMPSGSTDIGSFTTLDGGTAKIAKGPTTASYFLAVPGSKFAPVKIDGLEGFADLRLAGSLNAGGESLVLVEGNQSGCISRPVLLAVQAPQVRSSEVPRCGQHFELAAAPDGRAVSIRQVNSRPVTFYTYRDGQILGPSTERATARRPVRRAAPQGLDLDAAPARGAPAPLNLDQ